MARKNAGPTCPNCGTEDPLPISYGLPTIEALEASEKGEIALGGCCRDIDEEDWQCRNCGYRYHSMWQFTSELRLLFRQYDALRSELLRTEKALQKCTERLAGSNPDDPTFNALVHQHGAAFETWMRCCRGFEEAFADLNLALHRRPTSGVPPADASSTGDDLRCSEH